VDDNPNDLLAALRFASRKNVKLILVTGGLGPTDNDITRETLTEFTEITLQENEEVVSAMERRFGLPRERIRGNLLRQARVPQQGGYLRNRQGTSVGLVFESPDCVIVALPGPPHELQPMVRDELLAYLNRRFGTHLPGCALTIRFVGLGQSQIDATLKQHVVMPDDVMLSSQFDGGRVDFTFTLPADTQQDRTRLVTLQQQIVRCLGENVYATDADTTLEQRVIELLRANGETLAVADVAGGGHFAASLSRANGTDPVLVGAYVAPSEERLCDMLKIADERSVSGGPSDLPQLAQAAAKATGSSWAVAIGAKTSGPGGRTLIPIVLRDPNGNTTLVQTGAGEGRLVTFLLDQFRRRLVR
jgi:nicotinamide-nucleotide amidase